MGEGEQAFIPLVLSGIDLIGIQVSLNRASSLKRTEDVAYENPKQMQRKKRPHPHPPKPLSLGRNTWHITLHNAASKDTCFWYLPLSSKFQK